MKKKSLIIISILILVFLFVLYFDIKKVHAPEVAKIVISSYVINVELAKTDIQKSKGLSNRDNLCENCGMLFLFDELKLHNFWMGEMRFPLDILYIKDYEIVEIFKNIPVFTDNDYTRIYPTKNANKVLELNANWCDKNNIKVGDKINLINE
ncbi:MAG: DUF192 domain-containing protein [Patescibacteria group bacterium]|nr:DUF192 domain-containing protein [Patescibacteria group bacterium]MDD4304633.1 DUF192 domain-containing protein [Patescibacteria group bacterium]MDD4695560.1 DUF192 domain-containing protein [Patescibacteria group bacterium]